MSRHNSIWNLKSIGNIFKQAKHSVLMHTQWESKVNIEIREINFFFFNSTERNATKKHFQIIDIIQIIFSFFDLVVYHSTHCMFALHWFLSLSDSTLLSNLKFPPSVLKKKKHTSQITGRLD